MVRGGSKDSCRLDSCKFLQVADVLAADIADEHVYLDWECVLLEATFFQKKGSLCQPRNADVFNADALAADNADVLAADNAEVLAADTTDVLAADITPCSWSCSTSDGPAAPVRTRDAAAGRGREQQGQGLPQNQRTPTKKVITSYEEPTRQAR